MLILFLLNKGIFSVESGDLCNLYIQARVEGTDVEAWITPALSIHMDPSSGGCFYKSNLVVSLKEKLHYRNR